MMSLFLPRLQHRVVADLHLLCEPITLFNNDKDANHSSTPHEQVVRGKQLTAAETLVLFDSNWNPQEDHQAMHHAIEVDSSSSVMGYGCFQYPTRDIASQICFSELLSQVCSTSEVKGILPRTRVVCPNWSWSGRIV